MGVSRARVDALMALSVTEINKRQKGGTFFHYTIAHTDIPLEELQILQKLGANFNAVDVRGCSILILAIEAKRSIDCVKNLIKLGADPKAADLQGDTPLHMAVVKGNLELATFLISIGSDVHAVNKSGDTPLHQAFKAETNQGPLAKLLLENGANVNAKGSIGYTPAKLMVFIENAPFELIKVLKENGADFNSTHEDPEGGCSLLYDAVMFKQNIDTIRNLVELGADPKLANIKGHTPLFVAVVEGYVEAADYLISIGCDVNTADKEGFTPLFLVFDGKANTVPMAKLLLSKGANVNAKNNEGDTPVAFGTLHRTFKKSSKKWPLDFFKVLDVMKEHGADFNCVDNNNQSPLANCIGHSRRKILLQKLVDLGADPNFVFANDQDNMTLLHLAANLLDLKTVKWLLSLGVDVNKKDIHGKSALVYLFENCMYLHESYEMTKLLLEHGLKLDLTDNDGLTFVHTLAKLDEEMVFDTETIFGLLKKHGADFNALDNLKRSPLELAMWEHKSVEFITALLDHGADPKITFTYDNTLHFTALHTAAVAENLEHVKLLISRGCDVNALDKTYLETPLQSLIIRKGKFGNVFKITKILLKNGADPNIENGNGRTVLDETMKWVDNPENRRTIKLLISKGAVRSSSGGNCSVGYLAKKLLETL